MKHISKENRLFLVLACFFVGNTLIAEIIGPKMFSLEATLGYEPVGWTLFGIEDLSFNFSAGSILWPIVFIMTDVINEYFVNRGVRFLTYIAIAVISYAFFMLLMTTKTAPAQFWLDINADIKPDINTAFNRIFTTGMLIIVGSLTAFFVSQMLDAYIFQRFKKATGDKLVWLRATGSTVISQLFDSFIILVIVFYIGADPAHRWSWSQIAAIGLMGYLYKVVTAIVLTPMLYVVHSIIGNYLGKDLTEKLKHQAVNLD